MTARFGNPGLTDNRRLILWSLLLTVLFEALTCLLRFGFQMESTAETASIIGLLTAGMRIHHSYPGLVIILLSCWQWDCRRRPAFFLLATGIALFVSDLIHHFIILWIVVGDPQFDLVYP